MPSLAPDEDEDEDEETPEAQDAPSASDTDDDPDDATEASEVPAAPAPAPAAPPAGPAPAADATPDRLQAMRDYLAKGYGDASNTDAIKAAQAQAKSGRTTANIAQALDSMFRSRSEAHGGQGTDASFYNGLRAQANQPVEQAMADRQAKIQEYLAQNQLGRQAAADTQQQKGWDVKNEANNPGSKQSQVARHVWETANPGMKLATIPGWAKMSAADMALVKDPVDLKAKLDERALAAKQHADSMNAGIAQRGAAASAKADVASSKADEKATAAAGKDATAKGTNYIKMNAEVNGSGRAPPDIKQALKDRQSIDKANELIQGRDLNSLSQTEANLLAGELEKIATGGSGTEAGRQGLDPHTFNEGWAAFKNKFVKDGAVNPAGIGPFIQQQQNYLHGLKKVTDQRLNAYQRGVHDTYLDAGAITDDQSEKFQAKHPELFPELQSDKPAGGGSAGAPAAVAQAGPHGQTVIQNGVTFQWNGTKYVPAGGP